jgi:hypothetical protein
VRCIRQIEREALRTQASVDETLSTERRQQLRAQLDAKPNLLGWLFSSDTTAKDLMQYIKKLEVEADHFVPHLFNTARSDEVAFWLCEHASSDHRKMLRKVRTPPPKRTAPRSPLLHRFDIARLHTPTVLTHHPPTHACWLGSIAGGDGSRRV